MPPCLCHGLVCFVRVADVRTSPTSDLGKTSGRHSETGSSCWSLSSTRLAAATRLVCLLGCFCDCCLRPCFFSNAHVSWCVAVCCIMSICTHMSCSVSCTRQCHGEHCVCYICSGRQQTRQKFVAQALMLEAHMCVRGHVHASLRQRHRGDVLRAHVAAFPLHRHCLFLWLSFCPL